MMTVTRDELYNMFIAFIENDYSDNRDSTLYMSMASIVLRMRTECHACIPHILEKTREPLHTAIDVLSTTHFKNARQDNMPDLIQHFKQLAFAEMEQFIIKVLRFAQENNDNYDAIIAELNNDLTQRRRLGLTM
jgi:uncharacterized membrane protein YheB (UPF0754 family)